MGVGPVLSLDRQKNRLRLCSLPSQRAYHAFVQNAYQQAPGWLTPVELFSPFLSRAIARLLLEQHGDASRPMHIIEVGAGRGQLAADVLEYIRDYRSDIYATIRYTIVEISPNLANAQRIYLSQWMDRQKLDVVCNDVTTWLAQGGNYPDRMSPKDKADVHVIACEVLDNFPHDLVQVSDGSLRQAYVLKRKRPVSGQVELHWTRDVESIVWDTLYAFELLKRRTSWLDSFQALLESSMSGGKQEYWVPTRAYEFLRSLVEWFPNHSCTIFDFSSLPGAIPGKNGPVVQRVDCGKVIEYPSIVQAPFGHCDIMFPTDFVSLEKAVRMLQGVREIQCRVWTQSKFFASFAVAADLQGSTCQDGYNPVLSDFANAKVLSYRTMPFSTKQQ
jgi:hypothetical protein